MSKMISKCSVCGEYYCMECSKAKNWEDFCSEECEEAQEKENFD